MFHSLVPLVPAPPPLPFPRQTFLPVSLFFSFFFFLSFFIAHVTRLFIVLYTRASKLRCYRYSLLRRPFPPVCLSIFRRFASSNLDKVYILREQSNRRRKRGKYTNRIYRWREKKKKLLKQGVYLLPPFLLCTPAAKSAIRGTKEKSGRNLTFHVGSFDGTAQRIVASLPPLSFLFC